MSLIEYITLCNVYARTVIDTADATAVNDNDTPIIRCLIVQLFTSLAGWVGYHQAT